MDELDEIIGEFLVESYENLDRLDQDLVSLEESPTDSQLLGGIFRTIHTIKGTCGFLGYSKLEAIAHAGENLLSRMRDGELSLNQPIATALLAMVDAIRAMLSEIENTKTEGENAYEDLVHTLHELLEGGTAEVPAEVRAATPAAAPAAEAAPAPVAEAPEPVAAVVETPAVAEVAPAPAPVAEALPVAAAPVVPAPQTAAPAAPAEHNEHSASADSTIRVDVSLLDTLMNLVGELVLARNQIVQVTDAADNNDLNVAAQRLNLITTELQEGVMKTRMQPIGNVLSKFSRVVRDLAVMLGKQVRMEIEGKDTELDKTINEAIKDPLTHLVRNSVDHGIEKPEDRIAKGKPAEGRVLLRAFHEGGQVNIEIIDDGAGIDANKMKSKAVEKGLITPEHAARMTDREAWQLIFLAGFSTAEAVTNVSGRGVGMDVVKTNIESIGGTVDVHTEPGMGTTFKIKIPLTLAIIPALLVTTDGDAYAIPQINLLELVRLDGESARSGIEMIHGAPVYRLRGKLLPLAHLSHELSGAKVAPWPGVRDSDKALNIVVLQADGRPFGLIVDEINDTQEIVVKPLDTLLKGISAFAGATIMGDGRVALILDTMGLAQKAHVIGEARTQALSAAEATTADADLERTTLLIAQAGDRRVAMPLDQVARLEEFPRSEVEHSAGRNVVQYRNAVMPIVDVAQVLGAGFAGELDAEEPLHVVVFSTNGHSIGLMVDRIVDIVDEFKKNVIDGEPIVIQNKVTDLVDIVALVRRVAPEIFATNDLVGA